MSGDPAVIELEGVGRVLDGGDGGVPVEALRDVSLRIGEGEFVCITGPSGSGKSTLLNILGCLDRPGAGVYRLAGREVQKLGADPLAWLRRRVFGFVFQSCNCVESATALENVELPGRYAGMAAKARRARARELLARAGLADRADHLPAELSGGEQQRVAIARALMNGGRVVLADEPTGALDRQAAGEVLGALEELAARGHTVVVASHDPDVAARADRRIELGDGRVAADSGPAPRAGGPPPAPDAPQGAGRGPGPLGEALDAVGIGLSALRRAARPGGRARALLPALGVLVAVWLGALAFMVGDGAYRQTMNGFNRRGLDTIVVMPQFRHGEDYGDFKRLTFDDVRAIEGVPNVRAVSPQMTLFNRTARRGDVSANVHVAAVVDLGAREDRGRSGHRIDIGEHIALQDDRNREQVAVLGSVARDRLFPPGADPLGEAILIENVPFRVKGVEKRRVGFAFGDNAEEDEREGNNWAYIPYRTGSGLLFPDDRVRWVLAFVEDVDRVVQTADAIEDVGVRLHGRDVYSAEYPELSLQAAREYRGRLLARVLSIAGAALLAGNLSVAAVMLMAVRARRREIGIRMAAGARRRDILREFLGEALALSVAGGLAGTLAALASIPVARLLEVHVSLAAWHLALPFACAVAVAVPFAAFPAHRASRLDPALALSEA